MEKSYETYAKKILIFMNTHKQEVKKISDTANKIAVNQRFSDFGRKEAIDTLKSELANLNEQFSETIRGVVKQFCKEYSVSFAEDNADHSTEIANALKVIEMCGTGLTSELFRTTLEPLKGSYKALKIIHDVITIKHSKTLNVDGISGYDPEITKIIYEYMGVNSEISAYMDRLKEIEGVADYPVLVNYEIINTGYNGAYNFELREKTSYSVLATPDWMMEVGKQYEELAMKYPLMFSNYIPTNEEITLDKIDT